MPIYEYECSACGNHFEELIFSSSERDAPKCPKCDSQDVKRAVSAFATMGSSKSAAPASSCAPSGG